MAINLQYPSSMQTGVLIADSISVNGVPEIPTLLSQANGAPVSAALEIQSSLGALLLPRMTTAARNLLNATPGMLIFNSTTGGIQLFDNTSTWAAFTGAGTVTSVNVVSSGSGVSFSGGPITASGTITGTLSSNLQNLSDLVTFGLMVKAGSNYFTRSLASGNVLNISIGNADGTLGNPTINLAATGATPGSYTQADITVDAYGRITTVSSGGGSGVAPANGTYLIQTASAFLPNAQVLSSLSTGLMKVTTGTGVVSDALAGVDYYSPGHPTTIIDDGFANGNFFIGTGAGNLTYTSAEFNTGLGINSLHAITTGVQNLAAGHDSGFALTSGNFNVLLGELAGSSLSTLNDVVAVGFSAAASIVTGGGAIAIGSGAMQATTSATNVFAIGKITTVTNGISNAGALGYNASITVSNAINLGNGCYVGLNNSAPAYSLDMGTIGGISAIHFPNSTLPPTPGSGYILYSNSGVPTYMGTDGVPHAIPISPSGVTAGSYTVGNFTVNNLGFLTAASSATIINDTHISAGTDNLVIGFNTQTTLTGISNCTVVGNFAGLNLASGASNNTLVGVEAGRNITTATNCVAIGVEALLSNKVQIECIAIGSQALNTLADGAPGNSVSNIGVGKSAGFSLNSGSNGTYIGSRAGNSITTSSESVFLGHLAASALTTATNCTYIGSQTTGTDSLTNSGAFGYQTNINVSNAINLGSACNVGINQPSPAYNLDIANISNVSATRQATGTAVPTTASSGLLTYTYTAQTSGTTDLALDLLVLPVNKGVTVQVTITGVDTTHVDSTGGNIVASFMRAAGNISMVGAEYNKNVTSTGDFSVSANTGTQAVRLHATGVTALTYNWTITVQYQIG